jgi:hypothetical protein
MIRSGFKWASERLADFVFDVEQTRRERGSKGETASELPRLWLVQGVWV